MVSNAESGVRQALENREFIHVYQPIIDLLDGSVNSVESLVRWQHPTLGLAAPIHFLDQIHQQGLSKELTAVTLENVCRDMPRLLSFYGPDLNVGLNLSSEQLGDARTLDLFDAVIASGEMDPERIVVEVVEDLRSEHMELSRETIRGLRERSIRVVLDDFGTGAGTLSLLTDLTYDGLKIDRHFVSRIRSPGPARSVVEVMLAFSRENDVVVVAEGVEDEAILRELRDMGCRFAQGYHFARPAPLDDLLSPASEYVETAPSTGQIEVDLDEWRQAIEQRVPLLPNAEEAGLGALIEPIETELAALAPKPKNELLVDLGFRKVLAALYGGCNALAMDWGMETSRLAEAHGLFGKSATILSIVAGITPDPKVEQAPSAEALARAITLRLSTSDLTPTELTTIDNNLGVTLSNYGLVEHARGWWESALTHGQDCRSWPLAALNLAEISLDRLTRAAWTQPPASSTDFDRQTLEEARTVVHQSKLTPVGLSEAIDARCAILDGDLDTARAILEGPTLELDAVGQFSVRVGRTLLAEAAGEHEAFLDLSEALLKSVQDNHALRFQAVRARWVRVRALAASGRHEEAYKLQRRMTLEEREHAARHLTNFFEWMRLVVDVDRRYSELADLSPPARW